MPHNPYLVTMPAHNSTLPAHLFGSVQNVARQDRFSINPMACIKSIINHYETMRVPIPASFDDHDKWGKLGTLTVVPIPASFDDHNEWGGPGTLTVLFRKQMTAILWDALERNNDDPKQFSYCLSPADMFIKWKGPSFHSDTRPPSPAHGRGSLKNSEQMLKHARIYEEALKKVIDCYLDAVNRDDYIQWWNPDWGAQRKLKWLKDRNAEFTLQVWGPGGNLGTQYTMCNASSWW